MRLLILLLLSSVAYAAPDSWVVLPDGQVVKVFEGQSRDAYHPTLNPNGWQLDESGAVEFPKECSLVPRVIICTEELVPSPQKCTEVAPEDIIDCGDELVVNPGDLPTVMEGLGLIQLAGGLILALFAWVLSMMGSEIAALRKANAELHTRVSVCEEK